jgi:hypothetical protein
MILIYPHTFEEALQRLAQQKSKRGVELQPGCSDEELRQMRFEVRKRLNVALPQRYYDFLRICNGIDEDGLIVYTRTNARNIELADEGQSCDMPSLISENERLRSDREADFTDLVVFAYRAPDYYAIDLRSGKYIVLPLDDGDNWPKKMFDTFDELMVDAIIQVIREK